MNKNEFVDLINSFGGVENAEFFAIMNKFEVITPFGVGLSSSRGATYTLCKIDESRYKVEDGYKITLQPIDNRFAHEHYYIDDFISLMKCGIIVPKTNENTCIVHHKVAEPLYGSATLIHEFDTVEFKES